MSYPKPFKRAKPGGGYHENLYIRFECKKKKYLFCCKTADPALARRRAKEYYDAVTGRAFHLATSMRARAGAPTFEEVFKAYEALPLGIEKQTRTKNKESMRFILKTAGLTDADGIDRLSEGMVLTYQLKAETGGYSKFTINSKLRAARSLFSRRAMTGYRAGGLAVSGGWIDPFMAVSYLPEPKLRRVIPTDEQIARAHEVLPSRPGLYRAFLLAAYTGLRAGEIAAAMWEWIEGDVIYVGGREFETKTGGWRPVRIAPEVLAMLKAGVDKFEGSIVGKYPDRSVRVWLCTALKEECGFTARDPVHSLRRWYGSQVAMASGLYAAKNALGHQSVVTTDRHYAQQINLSEPVGMAG